MKHFRVVTILIASLLLWGCQGLLPPVPTSEESTPTPSAPEPSVATATPPPAVTPEATTNPSKISASGDPNAAINCKTGKPLGPTAPPVLGIGAASLDHVGDQAVVIFTFPRTNDLINSFVATKLPYYGGIGFIDPNLSPPQSNPNWFYDSTENRGFNWQFDQRTHGFSGNTVYFKEGKWTQEPEPSAVISATGSNLFISFPWSDVAGSAWYVSATDLSVCTSLGLGPDGKPMLPIPEGMTESEPAIISTPATPVSIDFSSSDIQTFATNLAQALKVNNTTFLFDNLDPAVLRLYGADQCRQHINQRKADPTTKIQVLNVNGSGPWVYVTEAGSQQVTQVYTLTANVTQQGTLTQTLVHFGVNGDQLDWFTRCSASSEATSTPTP